MNDFSLSFTLGFMCTIALFAFSFLTVVGFKTVVSALKRWFPQSSTTPTRQEKPKKQRKKSKTEQQKTPSPVRSIEIDPQQIDRIYVKKTG